MHVLIYNYHVHYYQQRLAAGPINIGRDHNVRPHRPEIARWVEWRDLIEGAEFQRDRIEFFFLFKHFRCKALVGSWGNLLVLTSGRVAMVMIVLSQLVCCDR